MKIKFIIVLGILLLGVSACVSPWQREYLADPIMQFDTFPTEKAVKEHLLGSREGSSGGNSVGGGGCGCN